MSGQIEWMKAPWFSWSPEGGMEFHSSAEEARERAEQELEAERERAPDGWNEWVDEICWGRAYGCVVEVERRPRTEEDWNVTPEAVEIVDYALVGDREHGDRARLTDLQAAGELDTLRARVAELEAQLQRLREVANAVVGATHPSTLRMNRKRGEYVLQPEYVDYLSDLVGDLSGVLRACAPAAPAVEESTFDSKAVPTPSAEGSTQP